MNIISIFGRFPAQSDCIAHLERVRWRDGPTCPYCGSDRVTAMPKEARHHCNNCKTSFSVTVGTIFHRTHLPLQKWFLAISLVLNAKKGISARQLSRDLEVNKNTAWRMAMQIGRAMLEMEHRHLLQGIVEADETHIGGKPRKGSGGPHKRGRGTKKIPVVGMVERGGRVKAAAVTKRDLTAKRLSMLVRGHVDIDNAMLITDEYSGYRKVRGFMPHATINHSVWYVDGDIHTNTIESFWAILKRGIVGQYHKVSPRYLPRYIVEFTYRYNYRKADPAALFDMTLARAVGAA